MSLSIMHSTLEDDAQSRFTLVYGNRTMFSIMFNEALQDLKDRHPSRVTLIQLLSRQLQEVPLLNGRIDRDKVAQLMATVLPPFDQPCSRMRSPAMPGSRRRKSSAPKASSGRTVTSTGKVLPATSRPRSSRGGPPTARSTVR